MKVKTLIKHLQRMDQNADVVVHGYESGFCDVKRAVPMKLSVNRNTEWYYGPHQDCKYMAPEEQGKTKAAVHIEPKANPNAS